MSETKDKDQTIPSAAEPPAADETKAPAPAAKSPAADEKKAAAHSEESKAPTPPAQTDTQCTPWCLGKLKSLKKAFPGATQDVGSLFVGHVRDLEENNKALRTKHQEQQEASGKSSELPFTPYNIQNVFLAWSTFLLAQVRLSNDPDVSRWIALALTQIESALPWADKAILWHGVEVAELRRQQEAQAASVPEES